MYFSEDPIEFSSSNHSSFTPNPKATRSALHHRFEIVSFLVLLTLLCFAVFGCGGGYPGLGKNSLSATSATIDAGQSYTLHLNESGSVLPVTWSMSCPLESCGSLSGSTTTGIYTAPAFVGAPVKVAIKATISGTSTSYTSTITVNPDPAIVAAPPSGVVGVSYSTTLTTSGGTGTVTLSMAGGTLPAGLTFDTETGTISGTPTTVGTSTFLIAATDQSDVPFTVTTMEHITVTNPGATLTLLGGNPPGGIVGVSYSTALTAAGGTAPYTYTVLSGALPGGLTLNASTGIIAGVPTTQGTFTFTAQVQDAAGAKATGSFSITISAATSALTLNVSSLPDGTVGVAYSSTIGVSGGTAPYNCTITSGTLPAGLTLGSGCVVSGTPTTAGMVTVTVQATDSASPSATTSGPVSITIHPAAVSFVFTSPASGTIGTPYTGTIGVTGGVAPYTCSLISGTVQAGLTFNANCTITGTPTTASSNMLTVQATDSAANTSTGPVTLTINSTPLTITTGTLPGGTVGTPYSSTIGVTGGTSPYACTITSGTLPAGLTLGANCLVSGTPTVAGTSNLTVKATDSSSPQQSGSGPVSITISPAAATIVVSAPPAGTQGQPYTGSVPVTGGTAPYKCSLTTGPLPTGLTLNANCSITGTPTNSGSFPITVKGTDSSSPANSNSGTVTLTIAPAAATLTVGNPPTGTAGAPYTGSIPVTGGTAPYKCVLASGTLPAGLTLNNDCSLTGTPTTAGSSSVSVTATDSNTPVDTKTGPVTITINPPAITVGNPPPATTGAPYTGTIPITGGVPPYKCALASGTLPSGLTLNNNCTITGTPTGPAGSSPITVTVTDGNTPPDTTTAPVTITVNAPPALTFTGSLPNAIVNVAYTQTLAATGGVPPYTYSVTAGTLPTGITVSTGGVVSGTPTVVGGSSFTVTAKDSAGQTAALPLVLLVTYAPTTNDSLLNGPYAFLFQGYDDVVLGLLAYQNATVGSFTANGTGVLTTGELDTNHQTTTTTGTTVPTNDLIGSYTIGTDDRGSMTITTLNSDGTVASNTTYAIVVKVPTTGTVSQQGDMIEDDNALLVGARGSGTFLSQTASAFTTGLTGSYAFGLSGDTPCIVACTADLGGGPVAAVGRFTVGSGGIFTNGATDANIGSTNYANALLNGSVTAADSNGRAQLVLANLGVPYASYPDDYAAYVVNATTVLIMSTDKHSAYSLLAGSATQQTASSFSNASMTGAFVGYENSPTNPGLVGATLQNVLNLSTATIFRGTDNASGVCTTTNVDQGGLTGLVNGLTGLGSGSSLINDLLGTYASTGTSVCTVATNGRTIYNYPVPSSILTGLLGLLGVTATPPPPRVVYLTGTNAGYFLETGYAGLGRIENQTGAPFSLATLKGTYTYGTTPSESVASIDGSGTFTADGAGHATSTLDTTSIGVGNITVLSLGVGGSYNYTLTDANAGRYLLGTSTVIYAISPTRFVLLDESPLTTSPTVALIY